MYKFKQGYYADGSRRRPFCNQRSVSKRSAARSKRNRRKKAFIRVFDGKMWYYASTSDINSIQQSLDDLYGYAQKNPDIEKHPIVAKYQINKDKIVKFDKTNVRNIPLNDKLQLILDTSKRMVSDFCSFC